NTQQFIYSSVAQNFNYSIAKEYEHLQDALEVDIKYFQNGELTSPIDVGVYDVEITYNFSSEVFKTKLVVTPRTLTVTDTALTSIYDKTIQTLDVQVSNIVNEDDVYAYVVDTTPNVGTRTLTIQLGGADKSNYNLD